MATFPSVLGATAEFQMPTPIVPFVPQFCPVDELKPSKERKQPPKEQGSPKIDTAGCGEVIRRKRNCNSPITNHEGGFHPHWENLETRKKPIVTYRRPGALRGAVQL
jgi:hypothetical protein